MVFIMQCPHCRRYAIMEDEWCGNGIECPLPECGQPIHLDPVAPAAPQAAAEGPKPPPLVKARPKRPAQ